MPVGSCVVYVNESSVTSIMYVKDNSGPFVTGKYNVGFISVSFPLFYQHEQLYFTLPTESDNCLI